MDVKTLAVGDLATNCYILSEGGRCLVIDPGDEGEAILRQVQGMLRSGGGQRSSGGQRSVTGEEPVIQAILLTHAHFDHTAAAGFLQLKTGAPVFVGKGDEALLKNRGWMKQFIRSKWAAPTLVRVLAEGDEVRLGSTVLKVWETPGHSPGSLSFVAFPGVCSAGSTGGQQRCDDPRSPSAVFCGDLIFLRGVGRVDLPGGDESRLRDSIRRVLGLPDDTPIFPGHGGSTAVGHEKSRNPFL